MITRNLFLAFACALYAVAATPEEAVKQTETEWAKAVVAKDYATLERVLAPDMQYTHSDGRLDTRQSYIDGLKTGKQAYLAAEHKAIEVRAISKEVALVRATLAMTAFSGGNAPVPSNFSVLRVYKLNKGQWQMVGHQSARLAAK